jgi:hypothetical protein
MPSVFAEIASTPDELLNSFEFLRRTFVATGQADLLLDLLLSNISTMVANPNLVRKVLRLSASLNRQAQVTEAISRLGGFTSWDVTVRIKTFARFGPDLAHRMIVTKYGEKLELRDSEDVFDLVERCAPQIRFPPLLLDNLYKHRQNRMLSRSDWERHVRTAHCLDQISDDARLVLDREHFRRVFVRDLIDNAAAKDAVAQIDRSKGTLLMSFHGSFITVFRVLFDELFSDGVSIQKRAPKQRTNRIGALEDSRAALFAALRALQNRQVLLMNPDARLGTTETINVLGVKAECGVGAAFLAYETNCNTAWYTVRRKNRRLAPVIVPGPNRTEGESYNEFKERLLKFVATNIEMALTGDPWNIALGPKWAGLLSRRRLGSPK